MRISDWSSDVCSSDLPIQGEGGIRTVEPEMMRAIRKLCDDKGLLLILDEIQTGMGRTGKLFAHEWSGITPDIMSLAKGLGGGFPVGAVLATEEAASGMAPGTHGTTFGGNIMAMVAANAVQIGRASCRERVCQYV